LVIIYLLNIFYKPLVFNGRAGIAWVHTTTMPPPPQPRYKAPLAFPQIFSLYFYSYTIFPDSLSLFGFKGFRGYSFHEQSASKGEILHTHFHKLNDYVVSFYTSELTVLGNCSYSLKYTSKWQ
jgi:hypothetical protein